MTKWQDLQRMQLETDVAYLQALIANLGRHLQWQRALCLPYTAAMSTFNAAITACGGLWQCLWMSGRHEPSGHLGAP